MEDDMAVLSYAVLGARLHALLRLAIDAFDSYLYLAPALEEDVPGPLLARALQVARERAERRDRRLARFEDLARALALTPVPDRIRTLDTALISALDTVHATDIPLVEAPEAPEAFTARPRRPAMRRRKIIDVPSPGVPTTVEDEYERMLSLSQQIYRLAEESYEKIDFAQVNALGREASRELDRALDVLDDLPVLETPLAEARERAALVESELAALRELAAGLADAVAHVRVADQMLVRGDDVYDVVFGTALENALAAALEALRIGDPEGSRDWDAFAAAFHRSLGEAADAAPSAGAPVDLVDVPGTIHALAPSMERRVQPWFLKVGDRLANALVRNDESAATITLAALCLAVEAAPHSPEAAAKLRGLAPGRPVAGRAKGGH
ncbi:hypothetical protein SMC26_02800 [Actinomadura fulvescens]|uniref:Uncharacterized protein n=1 Tax=Actinomadura fulvescens TaxID=46160 RepID=A0ABP6C4R2_9ACTN